jgi:hypothetical protein
MGFDGSALFMTKKMARLNASMELTTNLLHGGGGVRVGAEVGEWVGVEEREWGKWEWGSGSGEEEA